MNSHDIATIVSSRSFSYLVGTICLVILIQQAKSVFIEMKHGPTIPKPSEKK